MKIKTDKFNNEIINKQLNIACIFSQTPHSLNSRDN